MFDFKLQRLKVYILYKAWHNVKHKHKISLIRSSIRTVETQPRSQRQRSIFSTKVIHGPVFFFFLVFDVLCGTFGGENLNIETEKSKQTVFAQISLSQY